VDENLKKIIPKRKSSKFEKKQDATCSNWNRFGKSEEIN